MVEIALVNMPFASWVRPAFALSQLASLLRREFGDQVRVRVLNLNLDFAEYFGQEFYESISERVTHLNTGLGDWMFRSIAFPDCPDNTEAYLRRHYPGPRWQELRDAVVRHRAGLADVCMDVVDRHQLADYDVVGFTSMFAQHVPSLAAARLIKRRRPETVVALGGANCETPMGTVIAEQAHDIDFVFSGPALVSFKEFIQCVLDGRLLAADAIAGVLSRRNVGLPGRQTTIGRDHDINDFVAPDYDSFRAALQAHPKLVSHAGAKVTLFFETSRGCWWGERSHCTFCGLNGQSMGYRSMSAEAAVRQFTWLFEAAPWCTTFYCTDNVMPRHYPKEVFDRLRPPPDTEIYYEVKLPLSRQDMARMKTAGVTIVQPGIEALATSTLKLMNKGTTSFQNLQFLKNCLEFGIEPDWNLLIGFPGEDPAVYEKYVQDIPRLTHLPPPQDVFLVRFDRFSPYFNQRHEYQLDLQPMDFYSYIYPFDAGALAQLAYFFSDHSLAPYAMAASEWHDPLRALVNDWRARWSRRSAHPDQLQLLAGDPNGSTSRLIDARGETPREYTLDAEMSDLLRTLSSPMTPEKLAARWPAGQLDLAERLAVLDEWGLLFHDGGQLLSLALVGAGPSADPAPAVDRDRNRRG